MKLAKISLAVITSLVLMLSVCLPVQADEESGSVEISATVPLTISGVSDSSIGYHSATVSWETNGDATSQVFYDTEFHNNIADYAYTVEETALVSEHSVRLTGLSSGRIYHYRVKSTIPDTEFIAISEDYTFRTSSRVPEGPPPPPPAPTIETNLFGIEGSFSISDEGEILEPIEVTSEDELLTLTIPEGTIALDIEGETLETLEVAVDETPPDPPEDAHIIGLAYDFGPAGATFDPAITLTYAYDPGALPDDVAEGELVLAYYDEATGEWVELDCVVDTVNNTITASVAHFTTFAIIGSVTPPPEEEEEPPVGEEEEEEEEEPPVGEEEEEEEEPVGEQEEEEEEEVPPVGEEEEEEEVPTKPGVNWPLIGGIIGGVIVVAGLLIYFLVFRRRAVWLLRKFRKHARNPGLRSEGKERAKDRE